ncbi:MAG: HAD hydrolase family protein [Deltaproteobacteria bacterium]|jgi:3-deoxy-D-manno-octulosonate 8-phosphate phosphatase (KDO 8-P phosphatase)|nr:HAD hydrolase family protein [Deltaproteobacteria bacterium]
MTTDIKIPIIKKNVKPINLLNLKWVGFDVDGVMTDGGIILNDLGEESKRFHSRDGHGLKMLARAGLSIGIITGRQSQVVALRAKELGLTDPRQGSTDKLATYLEILEEKGLKPEETAFAGDDLVDLPVLRRVGLAMAPADACPEALAAAHFVSKAKGGHGAVREMVEFILKGQGLWDDLLARYYN